MIRCDIALLLVVATMYIADSTGDFTVEAVCGCNCLRGSAMYRCLAEEEEKNERFIQSVKEAIKDCEDKK